MEIDKKSLLRCQIEQAKAMDLEELREKFLELYGFGIDNYNIPYMRRRVLYKLQEIQLGGLGLDDEALLDGYADNAPVANLNRTGAKRRGAVAGAVFVREWHGRRHEVACRGKDRFEYKGAIYASLSAVAKAITGTKWNGRTFFGVK